MRWFVQQGSETYGPHDEAKMAELGSAGHLVSGMLVKAESGGDWLRVESSPFAPLVVGARSKKSRQPGAVSPTFAIVTILLVVGGFYLYGRAELLPGKPPPEPARKELTPKQLAWTATQVQIEKELKVPSSAKFGCDAVGDPWEVCVQALGDDEYTAAGWVDSKNALGVMMRADFRARWKREATGDWTLLAGPDLVQR